MHINKAQQLEGQGREMAARREITNALSKIEQNTLVSNLVQMTMRYHKQSNMRLMKRFKH